MKKKLSQLLIILSIILILDFIFTFFIISRFEFYSKFYPKLDHRIANEVFHHSFKKNVDTYDYWGNFKYIFKTNSLGFKDDSNKNIAKSTPLNQRIIINGDSFTEGIGFEYKDTFVGLLDKELKQKNIEILNAGVASQSPILYFKKMQYLIEVEKIELDELIIFLDISDIADEYYYNEEFKKTKKINKLRNSFQTFLIKNSSVYLLLDRFSYMLKIFKKSLLNKLEASKEFNSNYFAMTKNDINLYKALNVKRGNWTHNKLLWKEYGIEGRNLASKNLDKLVQLCRDNNINFTLVVYPWPSQIFYDIKAPLHRDYWQKWSKKKEVNFIDLFKFFEQEDPKAIIENLFIPGDIHWNKKGHSYIYKIFFEEFF